MRCSEEGPGKCDHEGCDLGYVRIFGQTLCTKCGNGCLYCSPSNIMACESCGSGFVQISNTCIKCSVGCLVCSSATFCQQCRPDYTLSGTACLLKLHFPCLITGSKGCINCANGYILDSNNTCNPDISCSSTFNCKICPIGTLFFQNRCLSCPFFNNCYQCDDNLSGCAKCLIGYFRSNAACSPCPSGCKSCLSNNFCTEANDGYYLSTYNG